MPTCLGPPSCERDSRRVRTGRADRQAKEGEKREEEGRTSPHHPIQVLPVGMPECTEAEGRMLE